MKGIILQIVILLATQTSFSQSKQFVDWPQIEFDTINSYFDSKYQDGKLITEASFNKSQESNFWNYSIKNINVSRSPQEVLITKNDQYAIIRCFFSNTIEIVDISIYQIVKSIFVPCPKDIILSNDGKYLNIASLTEEPFPSNLPPDDCSILAVPLTGQSLITKIDIETMEIIKTDTIKTWMIRRLFNSNSDSIIYIQGSEILEYNQKSGMIIRNWDFDGSIRRTEIDLKNNRLYIVTMDSLHQSFLNTININSGIILTTPVYTNGEQAYSHYMGVDTLSDRVFVQGKIQPNSEVLVFNAINLNFETTIVDASLINNSFVISHDLESIFLGAGFPNNTIEIDYFTFDLKKILPLPIYSDWHELTLNNENTRLYSFQYGASEDAGAMFSSPRKLDIIEYDIQSENFIQYLTTDSSYECSYARDIALTSDENYLIITNSPDNSISIINLPLIGINEQIAHQFVNIFPNPVSDELTISLNDNLNENYDIAIYNNLGQRILWQSRLKTEKIIEIDLNGYFPGQYLITVRTSKHSQSLKFIKI